MSTTQVNFAVPTLPQQDAPEQQAARAFELATARTNYNYMLSYLDAVPMSADLPGPEKFTLDYEAQVLKVFPPMLENFKSVIQMLLERELQGDLPTQALADIRGRPLLERHLASFQGAADEIVVVIVVTDGGRPHARVGGLLLEDAVGEDGIN